MKKNTMFQEKLFMLMGTINKSKRKKSFYLYFSSCDISCKLQWRKKLQYNCARTPYVRENVYCIILHIRYTNLLDSKKQRDKHVTGSRVTTPGVAITALKNPPEVWCPPWCGPQGCNREFSQHREILKALQNRITFDN